MGNWFVTAKIDGTAHCSIEADSMEEACEKALTYGDWEIEEYDINTDGYRGGYIEAEEDK